MFGLDLGRVKVKAIVGLLLISLLGSPIAGVAAAQEDTYEGPASITADQLVVDGEISVLNSTNSVYVDLTLTDNGTDLDAVDPNIEIYDMNGTLVDSRTVSVGSLNASSTVTESWDTPTNLSTGDYEIVVWSSDTSIITDYEIGTVGSTALIGATESDSLLDKKIMGIPIVVIGLVVVVAGLVLRDQ